MAILSDNHPVVSRDILDKREPEKGARFVTLKANKDVGRAAKGVEVPALDVAAVIVRINEEPQLQSMVTGLLENFQTKLIQASIANGVSTIYQHDISIDALLVAFELEGLSEGRISKDKIAAWFDTSISEALTVKLADKLGISNTPTEQETAKLASLLDVYRGNFGKLAAREVMLEDSDKSKLQAVLAFADDGAMKQKLDSIIKEAKNPTEMLGI